MVSLGEFSFDVGLNLRPANAGIDELGRKLGELGSRGAVVTPRLDATPANAAVKSLADYFRQQARSLEQPITPQIDTRPAEQQLSRLQQVATAAFRGLVQGSGIGSGFLFGAGAGVGAIGALSIATGVSNLTQSLTGAVQAGFQFNAQLENAVRTFTTLTGSAGQAQQALRILRQYADFTPSDTDEVIRGGQAFILSVNGDIAAMEKLVHLAGQLAATNPDRGAGGGFESAVVALREVLGGQTESIAERFNIPRSTIQTLKDAGLSGIALAEALVKAAHGSEDLVNSLSQSTTGRISNFVSAVANAQQLATAGFTSVISNELPRATRAIQDNAAAWAVLGSAIAAIPAAAFTVVNAIGESAHAARPPRGPAFNPNNPLQPLVPLSQRQELSQRTPLLPQRGTQGTTADFDLLQSQQPPTQTVEALSAEQLKAQQELQQKIATLSLQTRQTELQGIQKLFSDEEAAVKANEATQKTSINAIRDADIEAAGKRRDAALAGLEDEQIATTRARTLQDRGIADSNAAILDGLEQVHNANLKGLDEQLTAIQKRGDTALRELDGEIDGVNRKRDAALRALDEEARAEDRRHDAALRNIDTERDRRLGVIDQQLRALDAAALRDQRRQTDQSLARSLSDARNDLRNADTPEQRARARRAIADAEAAIQREAVNRQREDERNRLRDQQDAIRQQADAAKQAEQIRNQQETQSIAVRRAQATDQAKADVERLNAIKDRVREETKIEADSITERVKAENESYQQTVKDQQRAFELQARALADQRTTEDQELDKRRKTIQANYTSDADDAKKSAEAQAKEQEELTRVTLAEIAKRKRAQEEGLLAPVPIAPVQQPGLPPLNSRTGQRIHEDQAARFSPEVPFPDQNAGQGPGEPPSRGNIPVGATQDILNSISATLASPQANAAVQAAGEGLGSTAASGVSTGLTRDQAQAQVNQSLLNLFKLPTPDQLPDFGAIGAGIISGIQGAFSDRAQELTDATKALLQSGVLDAAIELLQIGSPSKVFYGFGADTAQGFLDGYQSLDLTEAARKPFEDLIDWMKGLPDLLRADGTAASQAWMTGYQTVDLFTAGRLPFEQFRDWLDPGFAALMQQDGQAAASAWQMGYQTADPFAIGRRPFEQLIAWMAGLPAQMRGAGSGSATAFGAGYMSRAPSAAIIADLNATIRGISTLYPSLRQAGTNFAIEISNGFTDYFDLHPLRLSFGAATIGPSQHDENPFPGRASGGPVAAWRPYLVGEQGPEIVMPAMPGSVLPADVSRNVLALAGGAGVGGSRGSVTIGDIIVNGADKDPVEIGREVVRQVVHLFDTVERSGPDAAPLGLGGNL